MITEWDDLLIHQIISTMDHVESSDPRWHNRHWFHLGDTKGEVLLGIGMGAYPNRNVMDGLAVATIDGAQYNVLVSRELGRDRYTAIGPLRIDVVQGLRTLHLALAPNDHDLTFDLTFESTMPPFEEKPHFQRRKGRTLRNNARYNQSGRFSGTLTVAGQTWEVTPDRFWGVRDRSWGLRPGQGEQPGNLTHQQRHDLIRRSGFGLYHYNLTQFPDYSLFYMINERPDGRSSPSTAGCASPGQQEGGPGRAGDPRRARDGVHPRHAAIQECTARAHTRGRPGQCYSVMPILPCYLAQGGGYGTPSAGTDRIAASWSWRATSSISPTSRSSPGSSTPTTTSPSGGVTTARWAMASSNT